MGTNTETTESSQNIGRPFDYQKNDCVKRSIVTKKEFIPINRCQKQIEILKK